MSQIEESLFCDGCGIEILGSPVMIGNAHYCCQDCADGLDCDCKPEVERDELVLNAG